jgi:orotidine-5'-phosphate decarboxylase
MSFTAKLQASEERAHSLLSLGLDPDPDLLPAGLARIPAGILTFLGNVVEATSGLVASYKLNLAFYERWGRDASSLLADTLAMLPRDVPVILDGKRGDIGNTAVAYAHALFEAWQADAVTVSPYLGYDSVAPFLAHKDRGVFIVCRTSNPGAGDFQQLRSDGETLYRHVARRAVSWDRHGNVGLVAGATAPAELRDVRQIAEDRLILVPGIGAQGADLDQAVRAAVRADGRGALIGIGRGILFASSGADYADAARTSAERYREAINAVRSEPAGVRP